VTATAAPARRRPTPAMANPLRRRKQLLFASAALLGAAAVALGSWYCYPTVRAGGDPGFAVQEQQHSARGYGAESARVDSQITLAIPAAEADAVYRYLADKYVDQPRVLQDRFPDLQLSGQQMSDTSLFTDEYFDTPSLELYRDKNSCRHRTRVNTTDPDDRKSGRELVQMKVTPPGQFTLRNELKFEVKERVKKAKSIDDVHPLIRLIANNQRDDFKKVYADAGVNPYSLRHIFTIEQTRRRGYVDLDGANIFSFSVDQGSASLLLVGGSFASVDLGLVEIAYTEANEQERKLMWAVRDAIIDDLEAHFPALRQNDESKYSIVLEQIMRRLPVIPALIRVGLL
jgi:hypothetical protein